MSKYDKKKHNVALFRQALAISQKLPQPMILPNTLAEKPCVIKVLNKNCITALVDVVSVRQYKNPIILNMASGTCPGGGVKKGSNAQEEFLCRISNLYPSLLEAQRNGMYPIKHPFIIKNVTFFKDENYRNLKNDINADVLVCNAFKLGRGEQFKPRHERITKTKIQEMLLACIENENDALVLSALGCGAYNNPPNVIAKIFHQVLIEEGYCKFFKLVLFAIIDDHNSKNGNLVPFQMVFS